MANGHFFLWLGSLHLSRLGAIGLPVEQILLFNFFMWFHKTAKSQSHVTSLVASCHLVSPPCQVWWYKLCRREDTSVWHVNSCDQSYATAPWASFYHTSALCKVCWPYLVFSLSLERPCVTRWSEEHVTSWVPLPHYKSPTSR